jgi:hypothetical protein
MVSKSMVGSSELAHILAKTRDAAAHGPGTLSTGEALAAALVLNRPDWLMAMKYTIAEAIGRIGPEWAALIPAAANEFKQETNAAEYEDAMKEQRARLAQFSRSREAEDAVLEFAGKLVTAGSAPGYRDVYLTFDLEPTGVEPTSTTRARISLRSKCSRQHFDRLGKVEVHTHLPDGGRQMEWFIAQHGLRPKIHLSSREQHESRLHALAERLDRDPAGLLNGALADLLGRHEGKSFGGLLATDR